MPSIDKFKQLADQLRTIQKQEIVFGKKILQLENRSLEIKTKNVIHATVLTKRIKQKKWKGLADTANQKKLSLLDDINAFIDFSNNTSSLAAKRAKLLKPYEESLKKPITQQPNWEQVKEGIIQALKKKNKKIREINNYIAFLESYDYVKAQKLNNQIIEKQNERRNQGFDRMLSAFAKEYFGHMAALVNQNELPHKTTSQIKTQTKQAQKLITQSLATLKKIFKAKPAQQKKQLQTIYNKADTMIFKLLACALSLYKQSISKKYTIASLDDISIENGTAIRELFLLLLATKKMAFAAINPNSKIYQEWQTASNKTTLTSKEAKIKLVTIDNLKKQGNKYNNKLVTIKGKITRVKITHKYRKAISFAFISNGTSEVRITLPHIKIDSGGLVPGSYAKVVGKWLQKNEESFDKPSLALDRISFSMLAKIHWKSWVALQLNKVYEIAPHSLNIQHSWKPGANGAINQLKYSLI